MSHHPIHFSYKSHFFEYYFPRYIKLFTLIKGKEVVVNYHKSGAITKRDLSFDVPKSIIIK